MIFVGSLSRENGPGEKCHSASWTWPGKPAASPHVGVRQTGWRQMRRTQLEKTHYTVFCNFRENYCSSYHEEQRFNQCRASLHTAVLKTRKHIYSTRDNLLLIERSWIPNEWCLFHKYYIYEYSLVVSTRTAGGRLYRSQNTFWERIRSPNEFKSHL